MNIYGFWRDVSLTRLCERKAAVQATGFGVNEEDAEDADGDEESQEDNRGDRQTYKSTDTGRVERVEVTCSTDDPSAHH